MIASGSLLVYCFTDALRHIGKNSTPRITNIQLYVQSHCFFAVFDQHNTRASRMYRGHHQGMHGTESGSKLYKTLANTV